MKRHLLLIAALLGLALAPFHAACQDTPKAHEPPDLPAAPADNMADNADLPEVPEVPVKPKSRRARRDTRDIVATFDDVVVKAGQRVHQVVVTFGDARVEGDVERDVVVILGRATILGRVGGNVINVGSGLFVEDGARVGGNAVGVGYGVTRGSDGIVAGQVDNVGLTALPESVRRRALQYWEQCLLLGRPLAPGLGWLWLAWGGMLLLHALLALLFPGAVRRLLRTMEQRPVGTAFLGVLGIPLLLLGISILGATVILALALPFLLAGLLVGMLLARTAVYQYLGRRVLALFGEGEAQGIAPFAAGAALSTALFLVPVLGLVVWLLFGLWAIGALLLTVFSRDAKPAAAAATATTPVPTAAPLPTAPRAAEPVVPLVATRPVAATTATPASATVPVPATTEATAGPSETVASPASPPQSPPPVPPAAPDPAVVASATRVSFWRRLAALVVDWVPLLFLAGMVLDHLPFLRHHGGITRVLVGVAYYTAMITWRGSSLGGILFGLRVVRVDGQPLTREVALVRAAAAVLSGQLLALGWFWAAWDSRGQTWHDKLAGTVVVHDEAPRPLV